MTLILKNRGVMKENTKYRYETYENLRKRVLESIKKYKNHDKIIVVCHGVVISSLTHFEDLIGFCETREIDLNL